MPGLAGARPRQSTMVSSIGLWADGSSGSCGARRATAAADLENDPHATPQNVVPLWLTGDLLDSSGSIFARLCRKTRYDGNHPSEARHCQTRQSRYRQSQAISVRGNPPQTSQYKPGGRRSPTERLPALYCIASLKLSNLPNSSNKPTTPCDHSPHPNDPNTPHPDPLPSPDPKPSGHL